MSGGTATGRRGWAILSAYALAHCAVDAVCLAILWTAYTLHSIDGTTAWSVFFVYNLLAFALQPLAGLLADRGPALRAMTVAGGSAVAVAAAVAPVHDGIFVAIALMGVGNAVFHVGGGVVSLRWAPGRAGAVGIFVAPGAAGVLAGTLVGQAGGPVWPVALVLLALLVGVVAAPVPTSPPKGAGRLVRPSPGAPATGSLSPAMAGVVIALLLAVVAVRSYVGATLVLPWKSHLGLLIVLTAGVVAGKAAGGLLGDRFGWIPVGAGALLISAPLMALGSYSAAAGIAGVTLFNMTMPITVAALALVLPGQPGLAFGTTCLALFLGAAPALAGWAAPITTVALLAVCVATAIALAAALLLLHPLAGIAGVWPAVRPWRGRDLPT